MKSVLTTSLALILSFGASTAVLHAQSSKDGAITPKLLEELRQSEPKSSTEKALHNAIAVQGMQDFFINNQRPRSIEDKFSIEVQSSGITDQKQSGRCCLFTGLNAPRAHLITRENWATFFVSQSDYSFWYHLLMSILFHSG